MTSIRIYHYTYRITNIIENKHYYGKRTSDVKPEFDIGIRYFSSSLDEKFLIDQIENPSNYKYKVVRSFPSSIEAINFEIKLHNRFDVGSNTSFYNRSKQTAKGWDRTGAIWSDSSRAAASLRRKGMAWPKSKEWKIQQSIRSTGHRNNMFGRVTSEETKNKIKAKTTGRHAKNICRLIDRVEIDPGNFKKWCNKMDKLISDAADNRC